MKSTYNENIKKAIQTLESAGIFKVIEKFNPDEDLPQLFAIPSDAVIACVVDVETTGTDPFKDEIVELGLIKFAIDRKTQELLGVVGEYCAFEEPTVPMSEEAFKVNGITPDMYAGCKIDDFVVEAFLEDVVLCVAHNAFFDRPFCEKRFSIFEKKHWACSQREVPWLDFGIGGVKLEYIAYKLGFYYDAHRASTDCKALLYALTHFDENLKSGLATLIENGRKTSFRIWATYAKFETKDTLKQNGYKFSDGSIGSYEKKCWYKSISTKEEVEEELKWLAKHVYMCDSSVIVEKLTAKERFSHRRGVNEVVNVYW